MTAQISDGSGQRFEDAVAGHDRRAARPALDLPLDDLLPLYLADQAATAAELDWRCSPPSCGCGPGTGGELDVTLGNATAAPVRGEAQLVSPFGSWAGAGRGPGASPPGRRRASRWRFAVTVPAIARPGQHWWALVKVMYFGRARYSEPAAISVSA